MALKCSLAWDCLFVCCLYVFILPLTDYPVSEEDLDLLVLSHAEHQRTKFLCITLPKDILINLCMNIVFLYLEDGMKNKMTETKPGLMNYIK